MERQREELDAIHWDLLAGKKSVVLDLSSEDEKFSLILHALPMGMGIVGRGKLQVVPYEDHDAVLITSVNVTEADLERFAASLEASPKHQMDPEGAGEMVQLQLLDLEFKENVERYRVAWEESNS